MVCIFSNCENNKIVARYLCAKHFDYLKYRRELEPYPRMKRRDGTGCMVDGYKKITVNGKRIFEHRHIVQLALGRQLTKDEKVHHIDNNGLNNSLSNLIVTSQSDHITKFHSNRPRVFNWNNFMPKNISKKCQICNVTTTNKSGLCKRHYGTYWKWRKRHKRT